MSMNSSRILAAATWTLLLAGASCTSSQPAFAAPPPPDAPAFEIAMPDYAQPVDLGATLTVPAAVCAADLRARIAGNPDFLTQVIAAAHLPEAQAHRLVELCAMYDAGAGEILTIARENSQGAARSRTVF